MTAAATSIVYLWLWVIQPPVGGQWQTFGAYPMTQAQCARIVTAVHAVRSAARVRMTCSSSPPTPLG
jgi:hypothetical protein